ncbi:hypothetical protein J5N97_002818 [Dioscorea zingiberensis]|uniref:Uncharacterized protein n=1 Tax=Dioscorea zingiberensis TaxID=325984 RepID=A0A9D5D519_9LILI|nr:hypothetical protein J5N97_002818 [Dioscorea zingiberensis]
MGLNSNSSESSSKHSKSTRPVHHCLNNSSADAEAAGVLQHAERGVHGDFIGEDTPRLHVLQPRDCQLRQPRLVVDVDERGVRVVGGEEAVARHVDPAEAELVPAPGSAEGAEHDVVVDRIGGVVRVGLEVVEEAEGAAPVSLGTEEEGLLLGAEVGGEGIDGFMDGGVGMGAGSEG